MIRLLAITVLLIAASSLAGYAVIPQTLNYQGVLTDAGGSAVSDGTYSLTFRLYDVPAGGSPLWDETQGTVNVSKGIFNVDLGTVEPLNLSFDEQYFLGISVEGEAELVPRIFLDAAAYSLASRSVRGTSNVIPADGFVGIGTLSPNDPLTVESSDAVGIRFNGSASAWAGIYTNATQSSGRPQFGYTRGSVLKASTYVDTDDTWKLYMNGSVRLTVKPDGTVGIGMTAPLERLDIAGAIRIGTAAGTNAGTMRFSGGDFEGYDGSMWKSLTATGGSGLPAGGAGQTLRHNGSAWIATSNLYNSGTAIGLGTTSPGRDLHIYRDVNATAGITIENPNAGASAMERISFIGAGGDVAGLAMYGPGHSAYANEMHLFNNRADGLLELLAGAGGVTILGSGAIGVNKSNPAATLDIAGGNWNLDGTNGDVRIGNDAYRLKIGVATDGLGAGTAGIRVQGGQEKLILGAGSAEVLSVESSGDVSIGSDVQTGQLKVYQNGSTMPTFEMVNGIYGGEFHTYEENGTMFAALEPDYDGTGAYFYLRRSGSSTGFRIDGNLNGTENPQVLILGSARSAVFDMSQLGNPSVQLPTGAIGAAEIMDEPGVASQTYTGTSIFLTGGIDVLLSRSITAPAVGYVLVIGTINAWASHTSGTTSYADFGLSDNSGTFPANQTVTLELPSIANSGFYGFPVTVHGLFSVAAGMHTFYILGNEGGGDIRAYDMQLSLLYIPTAYGTVSPTLAGGPSAGREDDATGSPLTAADIAAERAESEAFNTARIERELAEMRARLEALERQGQENEW